MMQEYERKPFKRLSTKIEAKEVSLLYLVDFALGKCGILGKEELLE